jgi:hypothetical protein
VHTDERHFEWDAEKAETNWQKHRISFGQAMEVFSDTRAVIIDNPFPFEERYSALGMDALGRVLVVVYAWRGDRIRIISARRATRNEQHQYEGE